MKHHSRALLCCAAVALWTGVAAADGASAQLCPSSHRTGIIVSEIMYNNDVEFIELFNTDPIDRNLGGYRLGGDCLYQFPLGTVLPARSFLVIAANPVALTGRYGVTNVFGPMTNLVKSAANVLPDDGGTISLYNGDGSLLMEIDYMDVYPWPVAADGTGSSLVMTRPDFGETSWKAWSVSASRGGSPGSSDAKDGVSQFRGVILSEVYSHEQTLPDYVEVYNHGTSVVDVGGWYLSDSPTPTAPDIGTNNSLYMMAPMFQNQWMTHAPGPTYWKSRWLTTRMLPFDYVRTNSVGGRLQVLLQPGGYLWFRAPDPFGASIKNTGDDIYLWDQNTNCVDGVKFLAQEHNKPWGRYPPVGDVGWTTVKPTLGYTNELWVPSVIFSEIMYHPASGLDDDEYVELYNRSSNSISLKDWHIIGGIRFDFPTNHIPAKGYIVVAKNRANLLAKHPGMNTNYVYGNYSGTLSDRGELITLVNPDPTSGAGVDVVESEVPYEDGWGDWTDGGGSSIELVCLTNDIRFAANWAGSDESRKSSWVTIDKVGVLENGVSPTNIADFRFYMLGAGECLVDDVKVINSRTSATIVSNFFGAGLGSWACVGNHLRSGWEAGEGAAAPGSLHIRASGAGESGVQWPGWNEPFWNHTGQPLAPALSPGLGVRISAKAKWVAGWPNAVFVFKGYWLEAPCVMPVPGNLGTPGTTNSRFSAAAGPAIVEVRHTPLLPAAGEDTVVSCQIADTDGVGGARLTYRIDPATSLVTTVMTDDGSGGDLVRGDSFYSATIPGQPTGTMVAFWITVWDTNSPAATNRFPWLQGLAAGTNECLVRFGDRPRGGVFGTYRLWVSESNLAKWTNICGAASRFSSEPISATLICNDIRPMYEGGASWRGTQRPYTMPDDPTGAGGAYSITMADNEAFMGDNEVKLDQPGQTGSDSTYQKEKYAYWLAEEGDIPACRIRFVHTYFNGTYRGIKHDIETPTRDFAESWAGKDTPVIFKAQGWIGDAFDTYTNALGEWNTARYRWQLAKKKTKVPEDDYSGVHCRVNAFRQSNAVMAARFNALNDARSWAGYFAVKRILTSSDSFGYDYSHNVYMSLPIADRSRLFLVDMDHIMEDATNTPLFQGTNALGFQWVTLSKLMAEPGFRRLYWNVLEELARGPLSAAMTDAVIDDWSAVFAADGIAVSSPDFMKTWAAERRAFILSELAVVNSGFAITSGGGSPFTSPDRVLRLTGVAPVAVTRFSVNGRDRIVEFSSVTNWTIGIALAPGVNNISVAGFDRHGLPVPGATDSVAVTYSGPIIAPAGKVVISEIMYSPVRPEWGFVEILNTSLVESFDLSGWSLEGVELTFADGVVLDPGEYAVVTPNISAYAFAYSNAEAVVGEYIGTLAKGGETLRLVSSPAEGSQTVDIVSYDNAAPWPTEAVIPGVSVQLKDELQDNGSFGNWAADMVARCTPGRRNSVAATLPPFNGIYVNEVFPVGSNSVADNAGDRDPWIELYCEGTGSVDLAAEQYYLATSMDNPILWAFPPGSSISSNGYFTVWADGEPGESVTSSVDSIHTTFRLYPGTGTIYLSKLVGETATTVDYVNYGPCQTNESFGSYPQGGTASRQVFIYPTYNSFNNPATSAGGIRINEWVARNEWGFNDVSDPNGGVREDWIEIYNSGDFTVDLAGYAVSDDPSGVERTVISADEPNRFVPAKGFLVLIADAEFDNLKRYIHLSFSLNGDSGDNILLYAPDGTLLDQVSFGSQLRDISTGRFPDGSDNLTKMVATAGASNRLVNISSFNFSASTNTALVMLDTAGLLTQYHYRLSYNDSLLTTNWIVIPPDLDPRAGIVSNFVVLPESGQRFYRMQVLETDARP